MLERNLLLQLHTFIYLVIKRPSSANEGLNSSESSYDLIDHDNFVTDKDVSNETENSDHHQMKDYEEYRRILASYSHLSESDRQAILKSFENKADKTDEIKLFLK